MTHWLTPTLAPGQNFQIPQWSLRFEVNWPRLGLGSTPTQLGASGWWRRKRSGSLDMGGSAGFHTTPRIWLNQSLHCALFFHPHTHNFHRGFKLERVENCGRSPILLPHRRRSILGAKKCFYFVITTPSLLLIAFPLRDGRALCGSILRRMKISSIFAKNGHIIDHV